jgi:amino acid transporter
VAFNMLEMIGVGPFITLPLVIAAAGYRLSVWAWVLGAVIAVADGLVWAELGAAFPRAGGSYAFLREIYGPERAGNWLSFLYVWQVSFTAPLAIASGCIGLSSFLAWFWPGLDRAPFAALPALHFELRRRRSLPAGHGAALSQSEFYHAAGLGALCRGAGGDCRGDRLRLCDWRRRWQMPASPACR